MKDKEARRKIKMLVNILSERGTICDIEYYQIMDEI